jgi:integrase
MSNNTILKALERLGYKGRMTGHGFRALAMTAIKEKLNIPHEVVDRQLAHAPRSQVDAAYDRSKFLDQRRRMMQRWADYVDGLIVDRKVIRFPEPN